MDPHFDGLIFATHAAELARRLTRSHPSCAVLDVRPHREYLHGHIPGAHHLAAEELERTGLPAAAAQATEVVIVGGRPADPAVRRATLALRRLGPRRVAELSGGMVEWRAAGLPEERGELSTAPSAA